MVETDAEEVGLCARCRHARPVATAHRVYWLCELSKTDPRFVKYPRLPVLECPGFAPRDEQAPDPVP